ncbi:hypothetical protein EC988_006310, partial [Linderina pennispora]
MPSPALSYHVASDAERKAAVQVRIRVFVEIQGFPLEEEVDEYDKTALHIVCTDDGAVVGTLRVLRSPGVAKIGRVVIVPEYQGKGIGKQMMRFAESYVAENYEDCMLTKLGSQLDKRGFYESCGYVAEGDVYDDLGCPHIWMYKPVART